MSHEAHIARAADSAVPSIPMHGSMGRLLVALAAALGVIAGCSLPRDVVGTSDGGNGVDDGAIVPRDTGLDGGPRADAFVVPGEDAYVAPVDAWVAPGVDAYVAPIDAYVAPVDAYTAPDAWVAPIDAYVAPDAWTQPTCLVQYGMVRTGYHECSMTDTACTFYANLGGDNCNTVCAAGGGRCLAETDNSVTNVCNPSGGSSLDASHCGDGHSGAICSCSRP